jgi:hypothetical protein
MRSCPLSGATRGSGQASVEFVAVLPALVISLAIAAQGVLAGWALWAAGNAARSGARAEIVGADAAEAARSALPGPLRERSVIKTSDGVRVRVRIPTLVPGLDLPSVTAASSLDESTGS